MATSKSTPPRQGEVFDRINEGICKALAMSSVLQHYVCEDGGRQVDVNPEYLHWYFNALEQQLSAAKNALEALDVNAEAAHA